MAHIKPAMQDNLFTQVHQIDQVNQLLEVSHTTKEHDKYAQANKWAQQLTSLNKAIVSKLRA